jgi:hypothetical protein
MIGGRSALSSTLVGSMLFSEITMPRQTNTRVIPALGLLGAIGMIGALAPAASAQLSISWFTIDSGGGTSSGGGFTLSGTIGQPDASTTLTGGTFTLTGGFWPGIGQPLCGPSDVAGPNQAVGGDGGLTADDIIVYLGWYFANTTGSPTPGNPPSPANLLADIAGPNQSTSPDGALTADDIIVFLGRYFAGC